MQMWDGNRVAGLGGKARPGGSWGVVTSLSMVNDESGFRVTLPRGMDGLEEIW